MREGKGRGGEGRVTEWMDGGSAKGGGVHRIRWEIHGLGGVFRVLVLAGTISVTEESETRLITVAGISVTITT